MRSHSCLAALVLGSALAASVPLAAAPPGPGSLPARVVLDKNTTWEHSTLDLPDGAVIVTNGFELKITVDGALRIGNGQGTARIVAFEPAAMSAPRPAEPDGANGEAFAPGPETGGRAPATDGRPGGAGKPGTPGQPGRAGKPAGKITITLGTTPGGTLIIRNVGEPGEPGSRGGKGGDGGSGEQGGRSQAREIGGVSFPDKGPGTGGRGGDGGAGGRGGAGGNGGDVTVRVLRGQNTSVQIDSSGGRAGQSQKGSSGGLGGRGGHGGRGGPAHAGRDGEIAPAGEKGNPGGDAEKAEDSAAGTVVFPPPQAQSP